MMLLALMSIVPVETTVEDRADVLFVEHFYDEQGRLVFDQLVPLAWNRHSERYDVIAWRLIKSRGMVPERDWQSGGYVVRFNDGETTRIIRADSVREEWNQHDSELQQRAILPKEYRRELTPAARPR